MPCALSRNLIAKSTQSLTAIETLIFGFLAINSSIVRTPNRGETATTKRSQEGNTASARRGDLPLNGPTPRTAIDGIIEGLSHTRSSLPLATSLAPFKPLHHAGLTPIVKGYGGPARPLPPGNSTISRIALVNSVGASSYSPERILVAMRARIKLALIGFTLRSS